MFRPGDVLLAINGTSLADTTLREAASLLKSSGDVVTLKVSKDSGPVRGGGGGRRTEPIVYSVELPRDQRGLGITLKGTERGREREGGRSVIVCTYIHVYGMYVCT